MKTPAAFFGTCTPAEWYGYRILAWMREGIDEHHEDIVVFMARQAHRHAMAQEPALRDGDWTDRMFDYVGRFVGDQG